MPKSTCNHCGQNIDFDISMTGSQIKCPTCHKSVQLFEVQEKKESPSPLGSVKRKTEKNKPINQKNSKTNLNKAPKKIETGIDLFFSKSFKVGKILTAIFLLLNVLGFCLLAVNLTFNFIYPVGKPTLPSFAESKADSSTKRSNNSSSRSISSKKIIELANKIVNTIRNFSGNRTAYSIKLISLLRQLSEFHDLDEIEESFEEYVSECKEAGIAATECVEGFIMQIESSLQIREANIEKVQRNRQSFISSLFYSILGFVVLLVIPLLLRIEGHLYKQSN